MLGLVCLSAFGAEAPVTVVFNRLLTTEGLPSGRRVYLTARYPFSASQVTNLVASSEISRMPTNGTLVLSLMPNEYTIRMDGVAGQLTMNVGPTNRVMDALELIPGVPVIVYTNTSGTVVVGVDTNSVLSLAKASQAWYSAALLESGTGPSNAVPLLTDDGRFLMTLPYFDYSQFIRTNMIVGWATNVVSGGTVAGATVTANNGGLKFSLLKDAAGILIDPTDLRGGSDLGMLHLYGDLNLHGSIFSGLPAFVITNDQPTAVGFRADVTVKNGGKFIGDGGGLTNLQGQFVLKGGFATNAFQVARSTNDPTLAFNVTTGGVAYATAFIGDGSGLTGTGVPADIVAGSITLTNGTSNVFSGTLNYFPALTNSALLAVDADGKLIATNAAPLPVGILTNGHSVPVTISNTLTVTSNLVVSSGGTNFLGATVISGVTNALPIAGANGVLEPITRAALTNGLYGSGATGSFAGLTVSGNQTNSGTLTISSNLTVSGSVAAGISTRDSTFSINGATNVGIVLKLGGSDSFSLTRVGVESLYTLSGPYGRFMQMFDTGQVYWRARQFYWQDRTGNEMMNLQTNGLLTVRSNLTVSGTTTVNSLTNALGAGISTSGNTWANAATVRSNVTIGGSLAVGTNFASKTLTVQGGYQDYTGGILYSGHADSGASPVTILGCYNTTQFIGMGATYYSAGQFMPTKSTAALIHNSDAYGLRIARNSGLTGGVAFTPAWKLSINLDDSIGFDNLRVTNAVMVMSNLTVSGTSYIGHMGTNAWSPGALTPGGTYFWHSNGVKIFILKSDLGSTNWTSTNLWF